MEVVSTEPLSTSALIELSTQRKTSRQTLFHIETLFRILLKLEDLENPTAIAATQIIKQKREKEIQQALELKAAIDAATEKVQSEDTTDASTTKPATDSTPSPIDSKYPEPETFEELIVKLVGGLQVEKVIGIMSIRKGRTLLKRTMPFLKDQPQRWGIWCAIFSCIGIILKKEKEFDYTLIGLYEEFEKHLSFAKLEELTQLSKALMVDEKKAGYLFTNKFTLSIIIALLLHAETLYSNNNYKRSEQDEKDWQHFVQQISTAAEDVQVDQSSGTQTNPTNPLVNNQVLKTIIQHLTRFDTLQTKPLLNVLTQADLK